MADDATLLEGMRRACDLEQIVAVHAENEAITSRLARRAVADGRLSAADYLASRPVIAELEAIQRAIFFAWESDCALHISSVSTARGIELVSQAKAQGLNISCDTCPHYLVLTEADTERLQSLAKCAPPLRTAAEQLGALGPAFRRWGGHDRLGTQPRAARAQDARGEPLCRARGDRRLPVHAAADAHRRLGRPPSRASGA